jgi:hypothetical protein
MGRRWKGEEEAAKKMNSEEKGKSYLCLFKKN